jgi:hypothetical protein
MDKGTTKVYIFLGCLQKKNNVWLTYFRWVYRLHGQQKKCERAIPSLKEMNGIAINNRLIHHHYLHALIYCRRSAYH